MQTDWYWEGNVQSRLAAFLESEGWVVDLQANTTTRERGIDLRASRAHRVLLMEVKGYPSDVYVRGERQGLPKKTRPSNQAEKWFAQVLTKIISRHTEMPTAELSIGLPETVRYLYLLGKARWALNRLGIGVYLVSSSGQVNLWLEHDTEKSGARE